MRNFEIVSKYKNQNLSLPQRATAHSAGYDFCAAETIVVPSLIQRVMACNSVPPASADLEESKKFLKENSIHPTLVPTGIKCALEDDEYLELCVRSSLSLKNLLMCANGVGIIDADYYNNPDNEGHIYLQLINLSPMDIVIHKGDRICQGIIKKYLVTDDDKAEGARKGGFGSTNE